MPESQSESARYTHGHAESVLKSHRWRTAENSAKYLIPQLKSGMSLLDVGCGPGTLTAELAKLVFPGHVVAVDSSAEVVEEARATCEAAGVDVTFQVTEAQRLPFPDSSFDVVHAHQVLQHVSDPVGVLSEMRRVCRPDGLVAARDVDYAAFTWFPLVCELSDWLALYSTLARYNGGEPDAGRRLLGWAQQAGFSQVTASASVWCYASEAERLSFGEVWAERLTQSAIAEQAISQGLATRSELERLAGGWRTWARASDGWMGLLHGEVICHP